MASSSHSRVAVIVWVLLVEALVTEGLVLVAGHLIHTRHPVALAGAVAAPPTRTSQGGGRLQPGVPRKLPTHTRRGAEHRSIRVLKPQIRTRKRVEEHQPGAHLLEHRIPMLQQRPRAAARARDQDGGVQRPVGVGRRQNLPLGTRVRLRQLITGGPVQDHQHQEAGAIRIG